MADTVTTHRDLSKIEVGGSDNTWGQKLNANFDRLDSSIGATVTKATTSGDIALTTDEHASSRIRLTGTLTDDLNVVFDGVRGGCWIIDNDAVAGNHVVTAKVAGQTGVIIPSGSSRLVFFNGTDMEELGTAGVDPQVAAIAALTPAADKAMVWSSATALTLVDATTYGRSLWGVASEAALKALINAEAGTDFQAYDADLAAIALLTTQAYGRSLLELANAAALVTLLNGQGFYKTGGYVGVNTQTTAYTLALTDVGKLVRMNVTATAHNLTIPPNSSVAFAVGDTIDVVQVGTGVTTIKGGTGVTLNGVSTGGGALSARWRAVTIIKVATDTWEVYGGIGTVA